ncbi:MAG: pilus assembly protein PilP [Pseudomonadota bacterium]
MIKRIIPLAVLALVAGCSSKDADLDHFIAQTAQEQPGGVEPLPEVKPYDTFVYADEANRSPFVPGGSGDSSSPSVRPDSKRNREFLEAFALDTLKMVGTMRISGQYYGLVRASDGLVHRVLPGNYLGQNDGRITRIEPSKITITEIVPDGLGGFMERAAGLALDE